jgi:hypothetical protein
MLHTRIASCTPAIARLQGRRPCLTPHLRPPQRKPPLLLPHPRCTSRRGHGPSYGPQADRAHTPADSTPGHRVPTVPPSLQVADHVFRRARHRSLPGRLPRPRLLRARAPAQRTSGWRALWSHRLAQDKDMDVSEGGGRREG